ncbi:uncharacterized protein [Halyomorpha halys]|uniref:uncharacterized protein n=1 Tax=Halyomorpha halys TaxID=286706 RepID=UPI0006D50468|nr:uncharacterized protein LOC106677239 [Halyomorpha halys]
MSVMEEAAIDVLRCIRTEGWGPLPYVPTSMFFVSYFIFLHKVIKFAVPKRNRVAGAFRWCMAFTLCSQAYEIWTKTISVVTCIFYDYLGLCPGVISSIVLTGISLIPLMGAILVSRRRGLQLSWVIHGPRTELGPNCYYLSRPPPVIDYHDLLIRCPSRSRSQEHLFRSKAKNDIPKPPKSA